MAEVKESKYTCWEVSGTLRDVWSDTICLMLHGFWGSSKVRLQWNYAKELASKWISSLRINLYNKTSRNMMTVTLEDHMNDVQPVLDGLYSKYENVFFEWHSLAGSIIWGINNHHLLKWILFRDSYIPKIEPFTDMLKDVTLDWEKYIQVEWYKPFLISKKYAREITQSSNTYMEWLTVPYLAVCCEKVWFYNHWKSFDREDYNQNTVLVGWAWHMFLERGTQEKLFKLSNRFIDWILS